MLDKPLKTETGSEVEAGFLIREMQLADVEAVTALDREIFSPSWSHDIFKKELLEKDISILYVVEFDHVIRGYAICECVVDEAELIKIAIAEEFRGQANGEKLLRSVLNRLRNSGIRKVYLEVSQRNTVAYRLYRKLNFEKYGVRENYYRDGEDAIVMSLSMKEG